MSGQVNIDADMKIYLTVLIASAAKKRPMKCEFPHKFIGLCDRIVTEILLV